MIASRHLRVAACLSVLSLLGSASSARAEAVTFQFTGTISTASASTDTAAFASLFPVGGTVIYTLTFDTSWPPMDCPCVNPQFEFNSSVDRNTFDYAATVAGHDYSRDDTRGTAFLKLFEGALAVDTSLSGINLTGDVVGSGTRWYPVAFDALFWDPTIGGGTLPSNFGSGFSGDFTLYLLANQRSCASCGADATVSGTFSTVARIPTPPTLLLMAIGGIGLLSRRLRTRR
jgi:hypothetical protein